MVILVIYPSDAELRMRVPNEKHVELFCNLPLPGMLAPLSFILLLTFGCACFGFLTRKLPENFNESWYIFVSVSTTIFIWIVILPTYFTTFYAYYQAALLAACLLLIASITLLCLYVPKLYAIYFVNENKLSFWHGCELRDTFHSCYENQHSVHERGTLDNISSLRLY